MKGLIYKTKQLSKRLLPTLVKNAYYTTFPLVGSLIYRFPSRKIKIIGVTGTDGKSSTVIFLSHILKKAGYKVGHFSSVSYREGKEEITTALMGVGGIRHVLCNKKRTNACTEIEHAIQKINIRLSCIFFHYMHNDLKN